MERRLHWFAKHNITLAEAWRTREPDIGIYRPTAAVAHSTAPESSPKYPPRYLIHSSILNSLQLTATAQLISTEETEAELTIACPVDSSHFFLDCVVDVVTKATGADLLRLDACDWADLFSASCSDVKLRSLVHELPYYGVSAPKKPEKSKSKKLNSPFNREFGNTLKTGSNAEATTSSDPKTDDDKHKAEQETGDDEERAAGILVTLISRCLRGAIASSERDAASVDLGSTHEEPSPDGEGRRLIIHIRDGKDMIRTPLGRRLLGELHQFVQARRNRGLQTLCVVSHCDKHLPRRLTSDGSFIMPRDIPGLVTIVTPPGVSGQRAVLADDIPRWTKYINERNLKRALRMIPNIERSAEVADVLTPWDLAEYPVLKGELEKAIWASPSVTDLATKVSGCAEATPIALEIIDRVARLRHEGTEDIFANFPPGDQGDDDDGSDSDLSDDIRLRTMGDIDRLFDQILGGENKDKDASFLRSIRDGIVPPGHFGVHLDDVIIAPQVKADIKSLTKLSIQGVKSYNYGVLKGNRIPGVMLYGPPGTGKTMLAKAVATEAGCYIIEISGAQILQRYVGESEKIIEVVFYLARRIPQCVVLIDEADSILGRRKDNAQSWEKSMVNQFLHEWDKMVSSKESTFVIVSTNRPQDIDEAIMRRLPRRLHIGLPGISEREKILEHYLTLNGEASWGVSVTKLARKTALYSGSDLRNLVIQAALNASEQMMDVPRKTEPGAPPERRVLTQSLLEDALRSIRTCVSARMLADIQRFESIYEPYRGTTILGRGQQVLNKTKGWVARIWPGR